VKENALEGRELVDDAAELLPREIFRGSRPPKVRMQVSQNELQRLVVSR
jgi:hypothetical protein